MTIKSVVNTAGEREELPFPKLMQNRDGNEIIYAFGKRHENFLEGVALNGPDAGCYAKDWHSSAFKDFHGSITLSNTEGE